MAIARHGPSIPRTAIVSYPKSGNTYVRRLLFHAWTHGDESRPPHVEAFCPSIELIRRSPLVLRDATLLKSHDRTSWLLERLPGLRVIYVVRDAEQVYTSYARQLRREGTLPANDRGSPEAIHRLSSYGTWEAHVLDAVAAWLRAPDQIHLVSYDQLVQDPAAVLTSCLRFLQIEHEPATIERAVAASSPDRFDHDVTGDLAVGFSGRANDNFIHTPTNAEGPRSALYLRICSLTDPPER